MDFMVFGRIPALTEIDPQLSLSKYGERNRRFGLILNSIYERVEAD